MLCGPFVPSNKAGSVAAPGLEEDGAGRNIACPGSGSTTKPASREGAELSGSFLSLEAFPSQSVALWSWLCLLRDPLAEPDLLSPIAHTPVYTSALLIRKRYCSQVCLNKFPADLSQVGAVLRPKNKPAPN